MSCRLRRRVLSIFGRPRAPTLTVAVYAQQREHSSLRRRSTTPLQVLSIRTPSLSFSSSMRRGRAHASIQLIGRGHLAFQAVARGNARGVGHPGAIISSTTHQLPQPLDMPQEVRSGPTNCAAFCHSSIPEQKSHNLFYLGIFYRLSIVRLLPLPRQAEISPHFETSWSSPIARLDLRLH